jgi:hypothetical protein
MPPKPAPLALPVPNHLLLPFAASADDYWLRAMQAIPAEQTRHVARLLQGMRPLVTVDAGAHSLSPPHERALVRAQGLVVGEVADGLIPWAAWERAQSDDPASSAQAWACVTPCHWAMGREHATLTEPAALGLSEADSRALMAAMQGYFNEDGITLHYAAPQRWLAAGELFRGLPTASLDRALGRSVDPWLPASTHTGASAAGKKLRRLQNEMQMLMYTHPINEARSAQRLLPVNSIWFSGTGDLPAGTAATVSALQAPRTLADAALRGDWPAYAEGWAQVNALAQAMLLRQDAGEVLQLTLCGERRAQTFESAPASWHTPLTRLASLARLFPQKPLLSYLKNL